MRLYYHPAMLDHDTGRGHPERADRLRAIRDALGGHNFEWVEWREPEPVELSRIKAVHDPDYVDEIESMAGQSRAIDPDTRVSEGSLPAAHLAAGAAVEAVQAVDSGDCESAFGFVRPPGHHAEDRRAMGFCLYNNIAVASQYLRDELEAERVLVIDWDVHHGNGTQDIFYDRGDVLYASVHQSPLFPGTGAVEEVGAGDGEGATVNVPFSGGRGDADYALAFERLIEPVARQFDPDFVLVSAGYDAHIRDPLAGMNLSSEGFGALAASVAKLADETADGRLVFLLEGGYDLQGLSESVVATVQGATGRETFEIGGEPSTKAANELERVLERQSAFWTL